MAEASRNLSLRENVSEQQQPANEALKALKRYHDKAYADIDMALRLEEHSNHDEAARFYSLGLKSMSKAMEIDCKGAGCVGSQLERARSMQEKMKRTVKEIKKRLESMEEEARLRQLDPQTVVSGEGATSNGTAHFMSTSCQEDMDSDMLELYQESSSGAAQNLPSYAQSTTDASEVLTIPNGVQLFFINSSGHVSAPSYPGALKVYKFPERHSLGANQPPAFLQVGEWLYPLLPGQSPSLKAGEGVFMFPDVSSVDQGASVGVLFSPDVSKSLKAQFQRIIQELTAMQEEQVPSLEQAASAQMTQRPAEPAPAYPHADTSERSQGGGGTRVAISSRDEGGESVVSLVSEEGEGEKKGDISQTIAKGIEIGAEWLSWGVVKGAELGGRLVGAGASKLKQHIQPDEKPAEIDEKYQTGAVYARKATGAAVKVSVVVLHSVCYLTKRLGEEIAPVISKQFNKMVTTGDDETDGKTKAVVDGVVTVTGSSIRGFGTVYRGLEAAAIQLAKSISQATVETVQHKYGENAGRLTGNSLAAAGNTGITAHNLSCLGVKAIAKRTAKDTGKAVVSDMEKEAK